MRKEALWMKKGLKAGARYLGGKWNVLNTDYANRASRITAPTSRNIPVVRNTREYMTASPQLRNSLETNLVDNHMIFPVPSLPKRLSNVMRYGWGRSSYYRPTSRTAQEAGVQPKVMNNQILPGRARETGTHEQMHADQHTRGYAERVPGMLDSAYSRITRTMDDLGLTMRGDWDDYAERLPLDVHAGFFRGIKGSTSNADRMDLFARDVKTMAKSLYDQTGVRPRVGYRFTPEFLNSARGRSMAALGNIDGHGYPITATDAKATGRALQALYSDPSVMRPGGVADYARDALMYPVHAMERLSYHQPLLTDRVLPTMVVGGLLGADAAFIKHRLNGGKEQPQQTPQQ